MFITRLLKVIAFVTTVLIVGCSSKPEMIVLSDSATNFSEVNSFSLFARSSSFYNSQNLPDASRNRIENAIEIGLESRGLQYIDIKDADIIVSYFVIGQGSFSRYNKAVRFCHHCSAEEREMESKRIYQPGMVVLDALDREKQKSIWRTVVKPKVSSTRKTSLYKQEKAIKEGILAALRTFPVQAEVID